MLPWSSEVYIRLYIKEIYLMLPYSSVIHSQWRGRSYVLNSFIYFLIPRCYKTIYLHWSILSWKRWSYNTLQVSKTPNNNKYIKIFFLTLVSEWGRLVSLKYFNYNYKSQAPNGISNTRDLLTILREIIAVYKYVSMQK